MKKLLGAMFLLMSFQAFSQTDSYVNAKGKAFLSTSLPHTYYADLDITGNAAKLLFDSMTHVKIKSINNMPGCDFIDHRVPAGENASPIRCVRYVCDKKPVTYKCVVQFDDIRSGTLRTFSN